MTQPPLMIVRAWQKKSSEVSTKSNDRLLSAVNKGFHAMVAVLSKDSDPDEVHCAFDYLNSERSIALKYDKAKDDPLREVVYGLLESLHVSLIDWTEERNQWKETVEIFTSSEGVSNPSPTIPIEPKEEPIDIHEYLPQDYQISPSEILRDEKMFKEEEMDNENMEGITANSHSILADSLDLLDQALNLNRSLPLNSAEDSTDISQILPHENRMLQLNTLRDEKMFKEEEMDNENMEGITANSHVILADSLDLLDQALNLNRSLPLNSAEDPTELSQILSRDNWMLQLNTLRDDMDFKDEDDDDVNSGMGDAVGDSLNGLNEDDSALRMMQPSDLMDYQMNFDDENARMGNRFGNSLNDHNYARTLVLEYQMNFDDEIYEEKDNVLANYNINNGREEEKTIDHSSETQKETSDSSKVEKKNRSSRHVSRPARYKGLMDDFDGDSEPSLKKSRSDSTKKADNKRRSQNDDDDSGDVCKKSGLSKVNETELECPQCEYRTQNVTTWIIHLRKIHSTNPALAGLSLLCDCGHESLSSNHWEKTSHVNTIVIRKRDGPIKRMNDEKATPQCVLCETYPKTARGYVEHLQIYHKSTLTQNGIYLMCLCGLAVRSDKCRKHLEDCNPRQFTLHKLGDEKAHPQCVLCEMYPKTVLGYAHHVYYHHKSSLLKNGIYLKCSCGLEVRSYNGHLKHLKECDRRQFALYKIVDN